MHRLLELGLIGRVGRETEESSLRWFFSSSIVFETRLQPSRLQHGDDVLDSSLRRDVDEIQTTRLAILHIACLGHQDPDTGVRFIGVEAGIAFYVHQSLNETVLLPEQSSVSFALVMSSVTSATSLKPPPKERITSSD